MRKARCQLLIALSSTLTATHSSLSGTACAARMMSERSCAMGSGVSVPVESGVPVPGPGVKMCWPCSSSLDRERLREPCSMSSSGVMAE